MTSVLIVEDEESLADPLAFLLRKEGFEATVVTDGPSALAEFERAGADIVLLDLMLPGMSGTDVCKQLRSKSTVPVIMVTARDSEIDKVVGLELGADDYVTKPFGLHELRARIAAVLRRAAGPPRVSSRNPDCFTLGSAKIDRRGYRLERDGAVFDLTPRELKLLETFAARPGEVLSRNDLLNAAWGIDYFGTTRTLDQHIAQLRKKLEADPSAPRIILTVHGVGYKLAR
jgi:two-component system response regulator RegX3